MSFASWSRMSQRQRMLQGLQGLSMPTMGLEVRDGAGRALGMRPLAGLGLTLQAGVLESMNKVTTVAAAPAPTLTPATITVTDFRAPEPPRLRLARPNVSVATIAANAAKMAAAEQAAQSAAAQKVANDKAAADLQAAADAQKAAATQSTVEQNVYAQGTPATDADLKRAQDALLNAGEEETQVAPVVQAATSAGEGGGGGGTLTVQRPPADRVSVTAASTSASFLETLPPAVKWGGAAIGVWLIFASLTD